MNQIFNYFLTHERGAQSKYIYATTKLAVLMTTIDKIKVEVVRVYVLGSESFFETV